MHGHRQVVAADDSYSNVGQSQGLGNLVKHLEDHRKLLGEDAAELMEVCEETEFENRRLMRQIEVSHLSIQLLA